MILHKNCPKNFLSGIIGEHVPSCPHLLRLCPPFDHRTMPWKLCDDISDSSGVIVCGVDRQADKHTIKHDWKQYHPQCTDGN